MAKKVIMTAPFEALTGNLSGAQNLEYAENNNPAFDAPSGVQYARNYKTRYIGARRSSTGLVYFQVRQKSAVKISDRSKMVMALLGGTGAVRAAILKDETNLSRLEATYAAAKSEGRTNAKTLSKWIYDVVYETLLVKGSTFSFQSVGAGTVYYRNPWVWTSGTGTPIALNIKKTTIAKFWLQLASNAILFYVSGMIGVAHTGDTFQNIIDRGYNVLNLSASTSFVKIGDMWLKNDSETVGYPSLSTTVLNNARFVLTDENPAP